MLYIFAAAAAAATRAAPQSLDFGSFCHTPLLGDAAAAGDMPGILGTGTGVVDILNGVDALAPGMGVGEADAWVPGDSCGIILLDSFVGVADAPAG